MGWVRPVVAGLLSAIVGYASSFTLVLAGLQAVGANPAQAASGLLATCLCSAVATALLTLRYRMPIAIAWSTPGAALLVSAGPVVGGFPTAVGAFLVCAALTVVAGLVPWLTRAITTIPRPVAGAMLAGILLPLCTAPVQALLDIPALAAPVILTWLVLLRLARSWAVPGALVAAVVGIALTGTDASLGDAALRPALQWTVPALDLSAIVGIALPLFLVTMAGQNVPGAAVLSTFGYQTPLRPALITTGLISAAGAPFGNHQVNLAAITAALTAGPEAHPRPGRRWIATLALAAGQVLLGLGAGVATALVLLSPPVLVIAVAGLALLPALGSSLGNAVGDPDLLLPAMVTFVVTASGVGVLGIGAAFWGLLAGLVTLLVLRRRRQPAKPAETPVATPAATPAPRP
jgi:benzoate membrane transport protein